MLVSLRIRFVGLSLWVARDGHAEVLFPVHGEGNESHVTTLVTASGSPFGEVSLAGRILDLTGLDAVDGRRMPLRTSGLLEIRPASAAPVKDPRVINDPRLVTAAMQLPYGTVSPLEMPLEGPFSYDGRRDVYVSHGVVWSAPIRVADGAPVTGRVRTLVDNGSPADIDLGIADAGSRRLELYVSCVSDADRQDISGGLKNGQPIADFRAYEPLIGATLSPPIFDGVSQHKTLSLLAPLETVHKLCPPTTTDVT